MAALIDACVAALLAAIALYGAVQIVRTVWIPICIGLCCVVGTVVGVLLIRRRYQRW